MFVVDDNLFVDKDYVIKIANKIQTYKKFWCVQAPLSLGQDRKMLSHLAKSGLSGVSIGIDSVVNKSLVSVNKTQNFDLDMKETIKNFHDFGIAVSAFLVIGFDHDDINVFRKSLEMIRTINFDSGTFFILTPYPGTELFKNLDKEKRIYTRDWSKYDWLHSVFKPKNMTIEELEEGTRMMYPNMRKMKYANINQLIPEMLKLAMNPNFALEWGCRRI